MLKTRPFLLELNRWDKPCHFRLLSTNGERPPSGQFIAEKRVTEFLQSSNRLCKVLKSLCLQIKWSFRARLQLRRHEFCWQHSATNGFNCYPWWSNPLHWDETWLSIWAFTSWLHGLLKLHCRIKPLAIRQQDGRSRTYCDNSSLSASRRSPRTNSPQTLPTTQSSSSIPI